MKDDFSKENVRKTINRDLNKTTTKWKNCNIKSILIGT